MARKEMFHLNHMTKSERLHLWKKIKPCYLRHFSFAFDDEYLEKKVEKSKVAEFHVIWEADEAVGILMFYGYEFELEGRTSMLYRSSAAIDKEFRNRNNLMKFVVNAVPTSLKNFAKKFL